MAGSANMGDEDEVISGINVTPLVDITLVLLIIFIVTASFILRSNIPLELPKAATSEEATSGLLTVAITKGGEVFFNGRVSSLESVPAVVEEARQRATATGQKLNVFISADIGSAYGRFAEVVDRLRLAGVTEIAMDTKPAAIEEPAR